MSYGYVYETEKPWVFTDNGQRQFLRVRDFAAKAIKIAGAVRGQELIGAAGSGTNWEMMACVDRLVELGELREVTVTGAWAWQYRVFVGREP